MEIKGMELMIISVGDTIHEVTRPIARWYQGEERPTCPHLLTTTFTQQAKNVPRATEGNKPYLTFRCYSRLFLRCVVFTHK